MLTKNQQNHQIFLDIFVEIIHPKPEICCAARFAFPSNVLFIGGTIVTHEKHGYSARATVGRNNGANIPDPDFPLQSRKSLFYNILQQVCILRAIGMGDHAFSLVRSASLRVFLHKTGAMPAYPAPYHQYIWFRPRYRNKTAPEYPGM